MGFVLALPVWVDGPDPTGIRVNVVLCAVVVKNRAVGRGAVVRRHIGAVAAEIPIDGLVGHSLTGSEQRKQQNDGFHGVSFGLVWL
ncbi:MAG: hypothetical protein JW384_03830 [Nitrosomonadaceae bacterium]|nr:hypothetical protein [Nitrosomonadaceae bacterium]